MIYTIQKMQKPTMSTKYLVTLKEALSSKQFGFLTIDKALAFIKEKVQEEAK